MSAVLDPSPPRQTVGVPSGCPLSASEWRVVETLADGLTYGEIALRLSISDHTVRTHLHNVYQRLGVRTSYQAIIKCFRSGWLGPIDDFEQTRETVLLANVENVLGRLADAVERRLERERITMPQKQYLRSFETYLRADSMGASEEARDAMLDRLRVVLKDAGVEPRGKQRRRREVSLQVVVPSELRA